MRACSSLTHRRSRSEDAASRRPHKASTSSSSSTVGARALASANARRMFASVSPTARPTTSGPVRLCGVVVDW